MVSKKYGFDLKGYIDVLFQFKGPTTSTKDFIFFKSNVVNFKILYLEIFTIG